jgi:type VI secretion system secreted protein VgrG
MPEKLTQKNRELAIGKTPLGEEVLLLVSMTGTEYLGRLFEYRLELVSENPQIKAEKIVGQNVTISLKLGAGKTRYFNGYIKHFTQVTAYGRLARYQATVVPWLWFLTRTADCRIYQDQKIPDIIKEVFKKHELKDFKDSLSGSYSKKEYCVQYRETDFDFVSRLMEQEGIYYFFKHENGKHNLVLADSPSAHESYPEFDEIEYQAADKGTQTEGCVSDWVVKTHLQPVSYALNDFDFKDTKKALEVRAKVSRKHAAADYEMYDYPGKYTETGDGDGYARKRIEEIQAQYEVAKADSDCRGICPGFTFKLTDHPRDDRNGNYLITSASYKIEGNEYFSAEESGECVYSCKFTAIAADQAFRTPRTTPKPTVSGPQTAIVVGPSGEEIYTDKYGRVKVKFHWDRYSKADENSSCWIRVAQAWAGKNWGAMYIPRIGQEVIVEFLEGDPDKPIITGRVYNAQAKPPYDLPTEKTKSTLKSNSSKGGEGFNEIRFEDKKGEEQIFIHAENDQDVRVKNDSKEYIGNERHMIVKSDQLEQVDGDKHLTVKGDQNEKIDGTISIEAGSDIHEKAGSNYGFEAGSNIHIKGGMNVVIEAGMQLSIKAGSSFVDLGPAGVSISGAMVNINSGGSAGSGGGCSPDAAKPPKEAATEKPGKVSKAPKKPKPPKPAKYSAQAKVLKQASKDGTPFCEECEKAKKKQSG